MAPSVPQSPHLACQWAICGPCHRDIEDGAMWMNGEVRKCGIQLLGKLLGKPRLIGPREMPRGLLSMLPHCFQSPPDDSAHWWTTLRHVTTPHDTTIPLHDISTNSPCLNSDRSSQYLMMTVRVASQLPHTNIVASDISKIFYPTFQEQRKGFLNDRVGKEVTQFQWRVYDDIKQVRPASLLNP